MSKYDVRQSIHRAPLAVAVGSVLAGGSAHAATITVNTADDFISPEACSLRAAIESANNASNEGGCASGGGGDDEIVFDSSLTGETITLSAFYGEFLITESLDIAGPVDGDPSGITISGNEGSRIFRAQSEFGQDLDVTLSNMTLTEGRTSDGIVSGGAVLAGQSDLTIINSVVTGNTSGVTGDNNGAGGGIAVNNGALTVKYSEITDNTSSNSGGALEVFNGDVIVSNSRISGNRAIAGGGGGMRIMTAGGAPAFDLTVADSTIFDNIAGGPGAPNDSGSGGGIDVFGSNLQIADSTVSGNSTTGLFARGGGVALESGLDASEVMVVGSTISGNSTTGDFAVGGGLSVRSRNDSAPLAVNLTNSTVSGNTVSGTNPNEGSTHGGGIYFAGPGEMELTHNTVAFNSATGTDGVHKYLPEFSEESTTVTLDNSMVVQSGSNETACDQSGAVEDPGFLNSNSLATDADCTGEATPIADIALGPLADNGGPTQTHALVAASVAIDAAEDCQDDFDIDEDQRGEPRPGKGSTACDIGAYEFQGDDEDEIFRDRFEGRPLRLSTE